MHTVIKAIGTATPNYKINQKNILESLLAILNLPEEAQRKMKVLFRHTGIQHRYSVLEDYTQSQKQLFFRPSPTAPFPSTAERMQRYQKEALPLVLKAIENLEISTAQLQTTTHLIVVSCTGMYAPGIDIELIQQLHLNSTIQRTAIQFMGCYAAFNALKMADYICKSDPQAKVLVVGVELCTLHLQAEPEEDNLLSAAIFADGAAALWLENNYNAAEEAKNNKKGIQLKHFYCDLVPQGATDMSWHIRNYGFDMRLSSYVPDLLGGKMQELLQKLQQIWQINLQNIDLWAIHPGGKRILETLEKVLTLTPEKNQYAYKVLAEYGNMSSVTVLFVLKEIFKQLTPADKGKTMMSMAFGPGLTLESALMEIV
ncbi:MAG: type III polyketide synthase [Cytophagales bacterium]|nr:MAG: type III polyketide synthase [Cytophagales bacterium]